MSRPVARAWLVSACVPMVLVHGFLTLLMIFPFASLLAGNLIQALFLVWWLLGTVGIVVLVYSAVTFTAGSRLSRRQVLGLVIGILASVPLILGFFGAWWVSVSAMFATGVSAWILYSCRIRPGSTQSP